MVIRLTKKWWNDDKENYIFDPVWFDAFKDDHRFHIPPNNPDGTPQTGKLGVVFWHEEDGKTIIPAGLTYCDGHEFVFRYHPDYASDPSTKSLSYTLPKRTEAFTYRHPESKSLLPFFDNLVSEGWLGLAQRNACHHMEGKKDDLHETDAFDHRDNAEERYKRFLTFGRGFHGAVAVVDAVAPDRLLNIEEDDVQESTRSAGSLPGFQPKMLGVRVDRDARSTRRSEMSTHIIKMSHKTPQGIKNYPDVVENEYMSIIATQALLPEPEDTVVKAKIRPLVGSNEKALIIERFDRTKEGGRIHFEELLQLRNSPSQNKCDFTYKDMADIVGKHAGREGRKKLFKRLVAQLVLGNTDSHMKNFALWQKDGQWEFTPNYDLLPTAIYKRSWLALNIKQGRYVLNDINPRKLDLLGEECGLSSEETLQAVMEIQSRIGLAKTAIHDDTCPYLDAEKREKFCAMIDKLEAQMLAPYQNYFDRTFKRPVPKHGMAV